MPEGDALSKRRSLRTLRPTHHMTLGSPVVDQLNRAASTSSHLNEVLKLLRKLMEYRSSEVLHRLEEVGRAASMLHVEVLLLIYHLARFGAGSVLEIGPYIGRSPQPLVRAIPRHGKK